MNFSHIDTRLNHQQAKDATQRFTSIITELGIRKDNEHVGSGLGGNNFQLLVLLNLKHTLVKRNITIKATDGGIAWSAEWLTKTSLRDIRKELDKAFADIKEQHKYLAIALEPLANSFNMRAVVLQHRSDFPELVKALEGKTYTLATLSYLEQMILACVLCQDVSCRLDNGDTSTMQAIGSALYDFPTEIILLSIRRFIQIERLVRYNMDEDPVFMKTLNKVNNVVL